MIVTGDHALLGLGQLESVPITSAAGALAALRTN